MIFENRDQLRDKLTYQNIKGDEFWNCEGLIFELFFSAGKEGPTDVQLDRYLDFQQESILYVDRIRAKVIDAYEREKGEAPARYYDELPMVDVVNINPEDADSDMEIVISFRTFRFLFYSRWKTYVLNFKNRNIVSFRESQMFEDREK